jgi:hypothetical protein
MGQSKAKCGKHDTLLGQMLAQAQGRLGKVRQH